MGCSVFFFKQKTAYEVRISDGSSDVCSSDQEHEALLALRSGRARTGEAEPRRQAAGGGGTAEQMQGAAAGEQILRIGHGMSPRLISAPRSSAPLEFRRRQQDRKSVVQGKRGAVRVDLGGRPTIKKK